MESDEELAIEQISEFQELFDHLDASYMDLVADFYMLKPMFTDESLQGRFTHNRAHGFLLIANALQTECILAVSRLLNDGQANNPSLRTIIRPFLRRNRERYAELLIRLESKYSDWEITTEEDRKKLPPELAEARSGFRDL
jgi:AbiU2